MVFALLFVVLLVFFFVDMLWGSWWLWSHREVLPEEGGHLQRVQPRAADEVHQIDGIVAHAARDHQEGLGGTGTRELVGWVEKCLGDFLFFLKLKSGSWKSKLARSSEKLVLLFQLWPQNDLSPSSCIQEAKPRPG